MQKEKQTNKQTTQQTNIKDYVRELQWLIIIMYKYVLKGSVGFPFPEVRNTLIVVRCCNVLNVWKVVKAFLYQERQIR